MLGGLWAMGGVFSSFYFCICVLRFKAAPPPQVTRSHDATALTRLLLLLLPCRLPIACHWYRHWRFSGGWWGLGGGQRWIRLLFSPWCLPVWVINVHQLGLHRALQPQHLLGLVFILYALVSHEHHGNRVLSARLSHARLTTHFGL